MIFGRRVSDVRRTFGGVKLERTGFGEHERGGGGGPLLDIPSRKHLLFASHSESRDKMLLRGCQLEKSRVLNVLVIPMVRCRHPLRRGWRWTLPYVVPPARVGRAAWSCMDGCLRISVQAVGFPWGDYFQPW